MSTRMWCCLSSFTSLNHLNISDSSISFPSFPPELPSITEISTERVKSQCYEGLISSLPGLVYMDIIIDEAEADIANITAGLRRTEGQKLKRIAIHAPSPLPSEKKTVSSKTVRGLGLVIKEHIKNLKRFYLAEVKCIEEDDLINLIQCCRHIKTMECIRLSQCGTTSNGSVDSYLKRLDTESSNTIQVFVSHSDGSLDFELYLVSHMRRVKLKPV
ncbi:uncharacterized protein LOC121416469 [Lytechinus variegatus]|uniref:uncharacterized protein LOC121416469 n=1 Tax=Lytechinus variegatus TaxID=7654 RepID=UPI001BB1345C|nr:uncharacterized protein LOC121416469 [Lytechinus variegatus]